MPPRRKVQQEEETPVTQEVEMFTAITPIQQTFIEFLLRGKNITQAASLAHVSRRIACYWLGDPHSAVRREYDKQRDQAREHFQGRVSNLHTLALTALEELLSAETPAPVRFQAARMIYEAHLEEHAQVLFAVAADKLVESEAARYFDPMDQDKINQIYLYDDRGCERIKDD